MWRVECYYNAYKADRNSRLFEKLIDKSGE